MRLSFQACDRELKTIVKACLAINLWRGKLKLFQTNFVPPFHFHHLKKKQIMYQVNMFSIEDI